MSVETRARRARSSLTKNRREWMMTAMKSGKLQGRRALAIAAENLPQHCPNCAQSLEVSSAVMLLMGRNGEQSIFSNECRFCTGCDVVVLDADYIREAAQYGLPTARSFTVGGFVDLTAVPENKKNTPLGREDNPIPFVEFASFEWRDRLS